MTPKAPLALLLLLLAWAPAPARAHVVAVGVGSQSELRLRPRRIRVKFNMGFSSLLGLGELKRMDRDGDGVIRQDEQDAYLADLAERVVPQLRLTVDGDPLELRVVEARGLGILGPIEQVGFDTWYELEAACDLGSEPHVVEYYDGTGKGETSEQLLWLPLDRDTFRTFEVTQQTPGPVRDRAGVRNLVGRDVRVAFAFSPQALERDRALALLESRLAGFEAAALALRGQVVAEVEEELNRTALRGVAFAAPDAREEFVQAAPMAQDRTIEAATGEVVDSAPEPEGEHDALDEEREMIQALKRPFSLLALAFFLVWGVGHGLMPGHGKTMVAAYLIGTQGRLSDAFKLGGIVTFTHTIALYTVGLALVYLVTESKSIFMAKTTQHLTLLSGVSLIAYGAFLGWRRWRALQKGDDHGHDHDHDHDHDHGHHHHHHHDHDHGHHHHHDHDHGHHHHHEGMSEEEHALAHAREAASVTTWRDLWVLGITGGLVPCPAGVTLVLYSLSFQQQNTLKCFVYLTAFSLGLAAVLIAIASAMVLSKKLLLNTAATRTSDPHRALQWLPLVSSVLICLVGAFICYQAFDPEIVGSRLEAIGG